MQAQLRKEWLELVRTWRILIVPLVFIFFAVGQPVTYKLMPLILESAGNMPAGTVIEIPIPSAGEVMASIISQLNMMGTITLILVTMGAIAGERNSGSAATILSKPLKRSAYILGKVLPYALLAIISLLAALLLAGYYTGILIGPVDWLTVWQGGILYLPFLIFVLMISIFFGTFLGTPLAVGGAAFAFYTVLALVGSWVSFEKWLPTALPGLAAQVMQGALSVDYLGALTVTAVAIVTLALCSMYIFDRQEI